MTTIITMSMAMSATATIITKACSKTPGECPGFLYAVILYFPFA